LDNHLLLLIIGAYLLGSIPFGLVFTRLWTGKNLRNLGSGNIGATNALRSGGKLPGLLTLAADLGKGALPVFASLHLFSANEPSVALVAAAAFYGHIFPVYLAFKGGKGVATLFGVTLPWLPWVAFLAFLVWSIALAASRYVSLASVSSALAFPVAALMLNAGVTATVTLAALGLTVIVRHAGNFRRLLDGTESKIGGKN